MVSLSEIPKIKNFITTKTNNDIFSRTNYSDFDQAIFDVNNILEIIDTLSNTNYSFNFRFHDTPIGEFYNLVIGKTPSGDLKTPFVLKYKCDESQLETYIASGFKFSSFKGDVSFYKYTDFFEQGYFNRSQDTNCPPNLDDVGDPIPCEIQPVDGSGGGTAGGGFGPAPGGPGAGGGDVSGCIYRGVYVINCDGDQQDWLHPLQSAESSCGSPDGADQYDVWECFSIEQRTALNTDCIGCPTPEGAIGANSFSLIFTARATLISELTLSDAAKDWVSNPDNDVEVDAKVTAAYNYLEANGFDGFYVPEAKTFTEFGVEAFTVGGDVDFANEVILDETFVNNEKLKCVYEKLTADNNPLFRDTVGAFINDPDFNLTFKVGNCATTNDQCTDDSDPYNIVVTFEDVSGNPIEIAQAILHEAIHAEIARFVKLFQPDVDVSNRPYLFSLYAFYKDWADNVDPDFNWDNAADHQYMITNYINKIANALKEFDNNRYPLDNYKSYAWDGLRDNYNYTGTLTSSEETYYTNLRVQTNSGIEVCN